MSTTKGIETAQQLSKEIEENLQNIKVSTAKVIAKRKGSTGLTIKAFNNSIKNLKDLKMIKQDEEDLLEDLRTRITHRWLSQEMNL